ncbi:TfoX/Sxy family DNA transformation protein [Microvirga zambiensis]|uniref:TfoX/Sxy family DNA transformation protein n=1 Tax=Microvirga zambiensis TaxID=1402137 RepID=UPI00191EFF55|nr:TfoX/Sxy family DNA transformation protein [Microvirga zambiensis]
MTEAPIDTLPGIATIADLRTMGSVEAYRRLKFMLPRQVGLNALYALEATLRGCHWLDLPEDVKAALRQQAKTIDDALRRGTATRCAI